MTGNTDITPLERFLSTLKIVSHEGQHLAYSWRWLSEQTLDAAWVQRLDTQQDLAGRLEAFISGYGRMQDTMGQKRLPRWLGALAETPGSMIENLNRAERLGVLESVDRWLEARQLRNRLIHEYMENPATFAADLVLARDYCKGLFATFKRLRDFAAPAWVFSTLHCRYCPIWMPTNSPLPAACLYPAQQHVSGTVQQTESPARLVAHPLLPYEAKYNSSP